MNSDFRIMGVVNVTPDSFSDGGRFLDPGKAIAHAQMLAAEGAAILDIGGESTRPGAEPVTGEQELERVPPARTRARSWRSSPEADRRCPHDR